MQTERAVPPEPLDPGDAPIHGGPNACTPGEGDRRPWGSVVAWGAATVFTLIVVATAGAALLG